MSASTHPAHPLTDTPSPAPAPEAPSRMAQAHLPLSPSPEGGGGTQVAPVKARDVSKPGRQARTARLRRAPEARSQARGASARRLRDMFKSRAGERWGRVRAPRWRIAAAAALACLLLAASTAAFANSYERGNWLCGDFSRAERNHRADPQSIHYRMGYGGCLILKGEDHRGLAILHNIVNHSDQPARVEAAWMLAEYIDSGGNFGDTIDEDNIDKAIEAYLKVVSFISSDRNYPNGNEIYEEESQIELKTHYRLPLLYFEKFKYGGSGTYSMHLLSSPSYHGDRNLNTYPEYSPYTVNSLERTIEFAHICIDLPFKRHFQRRVYEATKAECQVLKEAATALLPLERQALILLSIDSCRNDIIQCDEYNEVLSKISPIIRQVSSEIDEIIQRYAAPPQD